MTGDCVCGGQQDHPYSSFCFPLTPIKMKTVNSLMSEDIFADLEPFGAPKKTDKGDPSAVHQVTLTMTVNDDYSSGYELDDYKIVCPLNCPSKFPQNKNPACPVQEHIDNSGFYDAWGDEVYPGVYAVNFYVGSKHWETGMVDDWGFEIEQWDKYSPDNSHPPCCTACTGYGMTYGGPCTDCKSTGHPHESETEYNAHLDAQEAQGKCGFSGLDLPECVKGPCDCFMTTQKAQEMHDAAWRKMRFEALVKGRLDWGHDGMHKGLGWELDCPKSLHHHHDAFCELPSLAEQVATGFFEPENGWKSRA